jgi:hypothetical protein
MCSKFSEQHQGLVKLAAASGHTIFFLEHAGDLRAIVLNKRERHLVVVPDQRPSATRFWDSVVAADRVAIEDGAYQGAD